MSLRKIEDFDSYAQERQRLAAGGAPREALPAPGEGFPQPEKPAPLAPESEGQGPLGEDETQALRSLILAAHASNAVPDPETGTVELQGLTRESFELIKAAPFALERLLQERAQRDQRDAQLREKLTQIVDLCHHGRPPQYMASKATEALGLL